MLTHLVGAPGHDSLLHCIYFYVQPIWTCSNVFLVFPKHRIRANPLFVKCSEQEAQCAVREWLGAISQHLWMVIIIAVSAFGNVSIHLQVPIMMRVTTADTKVCCSNVSVSS